MIKRLTILGFAASLFAISMVPASVAVAMPIADAFGIRNAAPSNIEAVQFRRRGRGAGIGAAILGGAIIGGMLTNPYYYGPGPYYGPSRYYYPRPGYVVVPGPGDAVAYCMQRFRSYDQRSGTYLGYDGFRHPCP
jgi:BA14K-like protein